MCFQKGVLISSFVIIPWLNCLFFMRWATVLAKVFISSLCFIFGSIFFLPDPWRAHSSWGIEGRVPQGFGSMGCCMSKQQVARANRAAKWRTTGIVGLRDSNLKTLPSQVLDLSRNVRTLDVTHNRLVELPVEIGGLINLQRLMASENLLQRLPSTLGKLQSLKVLALDENRLTTLPDELGLLVRIERLSVSSNSLTSLPSALGSLRNLTLLNISHNRLKQLPESLGSCFSLEELLANENAIEELPSSICNLTHLKTLGLDSNKLRQLPALLLKECNSLQSLSVHENSITAEQLQLMDSYQEYEGRRRRKFDKQIDANVLLGSKGLDEGVDMKLMNNK